MPDIPKIPCIDNMIKVMGESMTESEARRMLDEATERTKAYAEAEKIPEWAAAERVATEMKREQELHFAQQKRQVVMDAGARFVMKSEARSGAKSTWGANFQKLIQKVEDLGRAKGDLDEAGFFTDLAQKKMLDGWGDKKNHLAIWQELEQLNLKKLGRENKVGFTGNEQALAIAESFFARRIERQSTNNRWGAYTTEVPGYMFLQTHSPDKLRVAGMKGFLGVKVWGKESFSESYRVWRESLAGLDIDWNRTVYGGDKEDFLKKIHKASYTGIHGDPLEQGIEGKKYTRPGGSLADKLSSQRLLWFANAESAFKYNEMWGVADTPTTILHTLKSGGKNTAMLMKLGTRPMDNVEQVRKELLEEVFQNTPENASAQEKALTGRRIQGQMDLLTGKASNTVRPWLTDLVDFSKNLVLSSKGTTMVLSSFGDRAQLQSRMNWEGMNALERLANQAQSMWNVNPEFAAEVGVLHQSVSGSVANQWKEDVRPVLASHKAVQFVMKHGGQNKWTFNVEAGMGMAVARKLGADSHLPWEKLDVRRQQVMTEYGFSPLEWDVMRQGKTDWDGINVVTSRSVQDLPNEVIGRLVEGKKTAAALDRARDELAAKLDFYIYDAIGEAASRPTASIRSIRTLNGIQRGEYSRELAELMFVFKSFPMKAAMTMTRQFQAPGGTMRALALVAQAGALGYIGGMAKDFLKGRTPKRLFDLNSDGSFKQINPTVWIDALARGGGLGIYGDLLFSDYDRRVKSALDVLAGPVLSEASNLAGLYGKTRRVALGDEKVEGLGYESLRMVENNLPLIGMFPLKSVYDYYISYQLKEALSPGVWRRTQKSIEDHNHQSFWIEPLH